MLRQVAAGTSVTITVNGAPVADLTAHRGARQAFLRSAELMSLLRDRQADASMRASLDRLAGDTTDDPGPLS